MKWPDIRQQYPNCFVLLGDLVEEAVSSTTFRVLEGSVLEVERDGKEIRRLYQHYKQKGRDVLYALPSTPSDFIVENIPLKGIMR